MSENSKRILEMVAEKKISVEEAQKLLSLVEPEEPPAGQATGAIGTKSLPKYLRVVVDPNAEAGGDGDKVNIRVPLALIRAGMKLTSLIPAHASGPVNEALREKGIDFDISNIKPEDLEELVDAIADLEVDIHNGKEKVRVYVE